MVFTKTNIIATFFALAMVVAGALAPSFPLAEGCCGGGDGPSCFPAGTQISLPDGTTKNIEDVAVGEQVRAYNFETGAYEIATVLELESPVRAGYYQVNEDLLRVTNEHPIYTRKANGIVGWASIDPDVTVTDTALRPIYPLEVGDEVLTEGNTWVRVDSLTYIEGRIQTYNLKTVTGNQTFFADGVLVHNKGDNGNPPPRNPPPPPPPPSDPQPSCSLSGAPMTIQEGQSATLNWNSSNATSASMNRGIGSVALSGSRTVSPNSTTTYTLTVNGPGGTATCSKTITVTAPPDPAPTCTISANPTSIAYNGSTILDWSSTNATSASINQGIGSVHTSGVRTVNNITSDTTYTLTVSGPGGTATCATFVNVEQQQNPPSCSLYADRSSVERGQPVRLHWSSNNAHTATLTDFGSVALSGSRTTYPQTTRTYTLTVTGSGGTRTCTEHVGVYDTPLPPPPPPPRPTPSCTINVSPNSVEQGKTAVLQWSSFNAVSATISQLGGYIPLSGSRLVYGNTTTQYFMTVRNAFGDVASCATTLGVYAPPIVVTPPPIVYPKPTPQPPVVHKYVPVSYVPYTGPEDTAYVLGLLTMLLASGAGAGVLYTKMLRRRPHA